mmetsp:Transcript_7830/g.19450  ORF Transcript_7830/g.19450 Transcript_7830/m.19450 type:complete len:558 (-) Transcript_7830:138-1811(-)
MFTNGKVFLKCMALTVALTPAVIASTQNANNSNTWIQRARKLNAREFMENCDEVFMNSEHIKQHSYLMSHFAEEVTDLCLRLAPNPDQGTCRRTGFGSLDTSLKKAFFRHAVQHTNNNFPMDLVASWGDAGYIISDKTNIEKDVLRNDLCSEVYTSIGEDFIDNIPPSKLSVEKTAPAKSSEPKRMSPPVAETDLIVGESNTIGESTTGTNNNEPVKIVQVEKEDDVLSIAAIISISCAVAALIVIFFYFEARRRKAARISHYHGGDKSAEDDGMTKVSTYSGGRRTSPFRSFVQSPKRSTKRSFTAIDEVEDAINNADWDKVYKLASQMAENDDGLSLPSLGAFKTPNRSHLGAEDQERTKTLDELAANGDWTGLAVTAALYAGETSGTSHARENVSSRVPLSPSHSKDVEEGLASMEEMVNGLSIALNAGNWSQVSNYANRIKDEKNAGSSFDTDSQVVVSSSSSIASVDTTNSEVSKKQTIEKLMRAGKWKGVSIMANMYEMESKHRGSPTPVRPYPTSPSHPYTDRRSIVRTKELQHGDRLQENNIVSFRRDP